MTPKDTNPRPIERADTQLDEPRDKVAVPAHERRVTVVGESLRFSARPAEATPFEASAFIDRYTTMTVLGEGGMGEVRLSHDARIGRDVAMKMIRSTHGARTDYRQRFLREVRVQGQLEHPSIVPVYDLGIGVDGATYFTMKRVRGLTLAEILDRLRQRDGFVVTQYSARKLLAAFQSVCLALDFAHARGVIHRDLKPANIMLGDFGEVYVLDWGIAKIKSEPNDPATEAAAKFVDSGESLETQVGVFVGTLGYLSPEQLSGEEVDSRSDVYALGAILFELLTLEPLHRGTPLEVAQSTVEQVDARCSVRKPELDVAPELDAICVRATNLAPDDRFQTARDLHDAIARYLDGDRDLEQRKALAEKHLAAAESEIAVIKSGTTNGGVHRAKALGELGRALALDPTNEVALGDIVDLFLTPPPELPPEVHADLQRSREASQRESARAGLIGFPTGLVMILPVLVSMGIDNWTTIAVIVTSLSVVTILCWLQMRTPDDRKSYFVMAAASFAYFAVSRVYGPLVLLPQIVMSTAFIYAMAPSKRVQYASITLMTSSFVVPLLLERAGVLQRSYVFRDGQMIIVPNVCELSELMTLGFLTAATLLFLLVGAASIRRVRNALNAAEERLSLQAWQLRQLIPERARSGFRAPATAQGKK